MQAEADRRRPVVGQGHAAGRALKKALRPGRKRELVDKVRSRLEGLDQTGLFDPADRSRTLRLQVEARRPGRSQRPDQGHLRDAGEIRISPAPKGAPQPAYDANQYRMPKRARSNVGRTRPFSLPESCGAVSDVGGSWQAAALVDGATEVRPSDRRLQDPAGGGISRSGWSINKKGRPKAAFLVRDLKAFKPSAKRDDGPSTIRHEADASKAQDHHGPSGGFWDGSRHTEVCDFKCVYARESLVNNTEVINSPPVPWKWTYAENS